MGKANRAKPVRLICGMISNEAPLFDIMGERLSRKFGALESKSRVMPFEHTTYYKEEMGQGLLRQFIAFSSLIMPDQLADIKLFTNRLEHKFARCAVQSKRRINLDPGYVSDSKLVLASTKDYGHRIYLGKGIYAEATLYFNRGSFVPHDRTYPDYRSPEYIDFFNQVRASYMNAISSR